MKKILAGLILGGSLTLAATPALAGRTAPLENIPPQPALDSASKPLGAAQVRKAILAGASFKGWEAKALNSHTIQASKEVHHHTAVVLVSYSAKDYSIKYKSSVDLNYVNADGVLADNKAMKEIEKARESAKNVQISGELIHPNYNVWVKELSEAINTAVGNISQQKPAS